jgi:phosphoribosyl-ATP pyrophosphohydrolase
VKRFDHLGPLHSGRRAIACGPAECPLNWTIRNCSQLPFFLILPSALCFGKATVPNDSAPLVKLERTIHARAKKPNPKSYTSQLLTGGAAKIGAKITEEAAEVVEAAGEPGDAGREHFIREVGDLMYHLLVLMCHRNCDLFDIEAELARRFGVSGLEEKASRKAKPADDSDDLAIKSAAKPVKKAAPKKKVAKAAVTTPAVKKKARRKTRL